MRQKTESLFLLKFLPMKKTISKLRLITLMLFGTTMLFSQIAQPKDTALISVQGRYLKQNPNEQKKPEITYPKDFYSKKTYSGNSGLGLTINFTDLKGINSEMNYTKYFDGKSLKFIALAEYSNLLNMQHLSFGGGATYNINPLKSAAPDFYYLSLGGGLFASYDMLDLKKELGADFERNSANLGGLIGVDNQIFISRNSAFVISGYLNYNFITKFSTFKWWGGVGYRYNF